MIILFVDSDVLLDSILIRQPFFDAATKLVALVDNGNYKLCTSVHSLLNVHYFSRKHYGEDLSRQAVKELIQNFAILSEDVSLIESAIISPFADFEDAVQYFAALNAKADAIITRNTRDYKHSAIPVLTAEQFLRTI